MYLAKPGLLVVLLFSAIQCAANSEDWSTWLVTYYQTKEVNRADEFWDRTVARGALLTTPAIRERLIGFFGAVFRENPNLLTKKVHSVPKQSGIERDGIALILWYANKSTSRSLLAEAGLSSMTISPVPGISHRSIMTEEDVDFLFGWFCATGDIAAFEPLTKIIEISDLSKPNRRAEYAAAAIAYFSERDQRVRTLIETRLHNANLSTEAQLIYTHALKQNTPNKSL